MRAIVPFASVLALMAMAGSAWADPILECRVLAGDDIAVRDCLRTQLDISYRAMIEAQDLARGAARQLDERSGTEAAVGGGEEREERRGGEHALVAFVHRGTAIAKEMPWGGGGG